MSRRCVSLVNFALRTLLPVSTLLAAGCASSSRFSPVAREFLQVPSHYLGNLAPADRRFWLRATAGDPRLLDGRNLNFSYDGEHAISGEGPLTFHLFSGAPRTVGIFIERYYDKATRIPPSTSLYVLRFERGRWSDITRQVTPLPFDPRLHYEFSPYADTLNVRTYARSHQGYVTPGRMLHIWHWNGTRFTPTRQ